MYGFAMRADGIASTPVRVRSAEARDAAAIAAIYNHYVRDTLVTFEEAAVSPAAMADRLAETAAARLPWLVAELDGAVAGYAHASKWKGRCAYRYSVETTVYLEDGLQGRGLGTTLYRDLLPRLRDGGMHAALAGIALPNPASVALHEKLGFVHAGTFRQVGFKQDRWVDVGYWQLAL